MDGFYYLSFVVDLAHIYTLVGKYEDACDQLEHLLSNPSWISTPFLGMDPRWGALREHPRFRTLIERYAPAADTETSPTRDRARAERTDDHHEGSSRSLPGDNARSAPTEEKTVS
jgi:hypothetical protein